MKLIIHLIIFLCLTTSYLHTEEISEVSQNFLESMKNKDLKKIKQYLIKEIKIGKLSQKKVQQLGEDVIMERITPLEYVKKITGHNIFIFLHKYEIVELPKKPADRGVEVVVEKEEIKIKLYYIVYNLLIKDKNNRVRKIKIELDFVKENDKLKLCGFII